MYHLIGIGNGTCETLLLQENTVNAQMMITIIIINMIITIMIIMMIIIFVIIVIGIILLSA